MASPSDLSQQDTEACDDSSSSDEDSFDINNDFMTNDTFQRGSQKLAQEKEVMIRPNRNIFESEKEGGDPETSDEDDTEDTFDIHRNTVTDSVLERYEKRKGAVAPRERPVRAKTALASETTDTFEETDSFDVHNNAWTDSFVDRVKNKMASEGPRPRPNRRKVPSVSTPAVNSEDVSGSEDEEKTDSFNVLDKPWTESFKERAKNKMASEGPRPRPDRRKIPSNSTPAVNSENVSGSQDEETGSFNLPDKVGTGSFQSSAKDKMASEGPRPRPSSRKVSSVSTPAVDSEKVSASQDEEEQDAEDEDSSNINHRPVAESMIKIVSVKGASATPTRPDRRASSTPTSNTDATVHDEDEISEDGDLEQTHTQHNYEGEISLEDGNRDIDGGLGVTHISASDSPGTGDEKELPIMTETTQPRTEQSLRETYVGAKNSLNEGHKSKSPTPQPVLGPVVEEQVKDESNGEESEDEGESIFSEMESNLCLTTSTIAIPGEISTHLSRPSSRVVQHNVVSDSRIRNTPRTKTSAKSKSGSGASSTPMSFANSAQETPPEPDRMGTCNSSESDHVETGNGNCSESDRIETGNGSESDQMETGNDKGSESEPEQSKSKSSLRVPSQLTGNSKGQSLNLLESEPPSATDPEAVEVSHSSCRSPRIGSVNREPFTSKKSFPQNEEENDASVNSESEISGELSHVDNESKSNIQLSSHPSQRLPAEVDMSNQSSALNSLSNLGHASFSSTEPSESFVAPLVPISLSNSSTNTNSNIVQAEGRDDTFHFLHLLHQAVRRQGEEAIPNEIEDVDSLLQECPVSDSGFKLKSANFLPGVFLKVSDKRKAEEFLLAKKKKSEERLTKAKLHLAQSSESEIEEIQPEPRPLRFSRKKPRSESNRPLKHPSEIYSQVMNYHHKTSSQISSQQSMQSLLESQSQSQKSLQSSSQPEQIVEEQNTNAGSDVAVIAPTPISNVPSVLTSPSPRPAVVPDKGENVEVALKNKENTAEQEPQIAESAAAASTSTRNEAITPVQSSHSSSDRNQGSPPIIATSHHHATFALGDEVGASVIQHEISTKNRDSTTSTTKLTIDSNTQESCSASQSNSSNLSEESAKDTDDGSSSDSRSPTRRSFSKKVKSLLSSSQRERSMPKSKVESSSTLSTTSKIRETQTFPVQEEEEDGAQKTRSLLSMNKSKKKDISSDEKSITGKGGRMSTTRSITNLESKSKHSESMSEKDKSDSEPESEVEIPEQEQVGQNKEYSREIEEDVVSDRGDFEEEEPYQSDLNNANNNNNNDEGRTSAEEEGENEATQQKGNSSRRENKTFTTAPTSNRNSQSSALSSQSLELSGNSQSRSKNQNKDKSGSNSSPAKAKSGIRRSREPLSPASRTGTRSSPRMEQSTKYKSVRNRSCSEEETVHPPSPKRSKQSVIQPLRLYDTLPFQREGQHDPIENRGSRSLSHQSVRLNSKSHSDSATATVNTSRSVRSVRGSQISTPPIVAPSEAEATRIIPARRQLTTSHAEPEPPAGTSGAASVIRGKKKSSEREGINVERMESVRAPPKKMLPVPKKRAAPKVKKDVNYYMRNDNIVSKEDVLQNLQEFNIKISKRKVDELHEYLNTRLEKLLDELTENSGRPNGMFNYRHLEAVLKREGLVPPELGKNSLLLIFASTLIHSDYCKAKGVLIPKDGEKDTHEF